MALSTASLRTQADRPRPRRRCRPSRARSTCRARRRSARRVEPSKPTAPRRARRRRPTGPAVGRGHDDAVAGMRQADLRSPSAPAARPLPAHRAGAAAGGALVVQPDRLAGHTHQLADERLEQEARGDEARPVLSRPRSRRAAGASVDPSSQAAPAPRLGPDRPGAHRDVGTVDRSCASSPGRVALDGDHAGLLAAAGQVGHQHLALGQAQVGRLVQLVGRAGRPRARR